MILDILRFELRSRFSQWTTLVLYLMLAFQGIWYTKGTFDYYVNEAVLMNAPSIFYKNFAAGGILMIIMVAVITGGVLYKDIEHKAGHWVYAMPMREKRFFLGRFLAAFLINVLVAMGYFVGMVLVPYSGIGETARFGPTPFGQMVHGFFCLTVPNLFLMTAIIFFALVYFRKMAAGYMALLLTVIIFLVLQSVAEGSGTTPLLMVAESFAYVAVSHVLDTMDSTQKNTAYLPFTGYLLMNRLVWMGVALLLLGLAYRRFSFRYFFNTDTGKQTQVTGQTEKPAFLQRIPMPSLSFRTSDFLKKLFSLLALEFKNIVRPVGFRVILGIILLMVTMQNLLWNATYYIGPSHPVTTHMVNFRLTFGVFIMILLMIWAGELFFKDKTLKVWQLTDALPVPVWVLQLSRLMAISGVALLLAVSFVLLGMAAQVLQGGFQEIDLAQYASDVLGFRWGWLTYVLWICFVFFIGGLTGNRLLTHILAIGLFFFMIISFEMGLAEQTIFAYAAVPGLEDYSEVSGYSIWAVASRWYFPMWVALAGVFVLLGILFWHRGQGQSWLRKFTFSGSQLYWPGKLAVVVALVLFFGLQSFIVRNVNGKGNFTPAAQQEADAANYERKYAYLSRLPQPKYSRVDLTLDYFPQQRKAVYQAEITLKNTAARPIDTLYLNFKEFVAVQTLQTTGGRLEKLYEDETHGLSAWRLPQPLDTGQTLPLTLKAEKQYQGFTQSGDEPQPDLMFNGSFGSIREFLPVIGYDADKELSENRKRSEQGLPKLTSRMAAVNDSLALRQDAYAPDALWVNGTLTIGTDAGQTAVAPGQLTRQWEKAGRHYFRFEIAKPAPFDWYVGTGRYASSVVNEKGVQTTVLYDPKHRYNIAYYQTILHKAVAFINQHLGDYPYRQVRMVEIPFYQKKFYAFPNTIAVSEKEGWLADTSGLQEKAFLHLSVASQVFAHWAQANIPVANVQGADMLRVALPEALALRFVQEQLGVKATDLLVEKKRNLYGKERNNEANREPALLYADGADYLEINKGAIALYHAMQSVGAAKFASLVRQFDPKNPRDYQTFLSFYNKLKPGLQPAGQAAFVRVY